MRILFGAVNRIVQGPYPKADRHTVRSCCCSFSSWPAAKVHLLKCLARAEHARKRQILAQRLVVVSTTQSAGRAKGFVRWKMEDRQKVVAWHKAGVMPVPGVLLPENGSRVTAVGMTSTIEAGSALQS